MSPRKQASRTPNLVGAHVSVAGGLERAFERAEGLGCNAIQIFVKNANQWQARPLDDARVDAFRAAREKSRVRAVVAHASYLINLASVEEPTASRSEDALVDELDRCHRLGVDGLVLHPGAHLGDGVQLGIERAGAMLDRVFDRLPVCDTVLLLENTAGQGTYLGATLDELAVLRDQASRRDRIGFCLDTCHAFAAGAPLHRAAGPRAWLDDVERALGLEHVRCFHFNDSKTPCGSNRDRHANVGEGHIGSRTFAQLMRAPQLRQIPKILETPMGERGDGHRRDLARLVAQARRRVQTPPLQIARARPAKGRRKLPKETL